jgi:hypothetical protein
MRTLFYAMLFAWVSCTPVKNGPVHDKDQTNNSTPVNITPAAAGTQNPIGILVNIPMSVPEANKKRLQVYKDLGVQLVRHTITLESWNGSSYFYDMLNNAGYRILLNITATPQGRPRPFPSDMAKYRKDLNAVLSVYKPEMVVIENEEYNVTYYNGSAQDYINQLKVGIEVAHQHGLKVANGGLTGRILSLLTYYDYRKRGMMKEADDFARRTQPDDILRSLPDLSSNRRFSKGMAAMDSLITAYKDMNLDYVNFHWYEPIKYKEPKNNGADDVKSIDTKALGEMIAFLKRRTGKSVMTNEIGQINQSTTILQSILEQCLTSGLSYVIWYSGDGESINEAEAIHNTDGTLRETGKTFAAYLKTKFPK